MKRQGKVQLLLSALIGICCVAHSAETKDTKAAATAAPAPAAAAPAPAPAPAAATAPFVSMNEFCSAKLVSVAAQTTRGEVITGKCFIADNTAVPVVTAILRRALKSHNIVVTNDKNEAKCVISAAFSQRYYRRRMYTTLRVTFGENKPGEIPIWSGTASINSRGNTPVTTYAASMTGAVMYVFLQVTSTHVNRNMLQSYYQRLLAVGD